jgi:D-aminoacyl-tRNA deacylase
MRAVVQRVTHASVQVDGHTTGAIQTGLLVLLGVAKQDTPADADYLARKILAMRVFPDSEAKMNLNLSQAGGALLVVSQFTLYGDMRRGLRPSFDQAAPPDLAKSLYEHFLTCCRDQGANVQTGIFQANMQIQLLNDGPLTILIDSNKVF